MAFGDLWVVTTIDEHGKPDVYPNQLPNEVLRFVRIALLERPDGVERIEIERVKS